MQDHSEDSPEPASGTAFVELVADGQAADELTAAESGEPRSDSFSLQVEGPDGIDALFRFDAPPSPTWLAHVLRGGLAC